MKTTRLRKADEDTKAARVKLAKLKKRGEKVEMSLDEMREVIFDLMEKAQR